MSFNSSLSFCVPIFSLSFSYYYFYIQTGTFLIFDPTFSLFLSVARLVKRMKVHLAKRIVSLLVPVLKYVLERFQEFDSVTRRQVLLSVAQITHRADPTCAKILWESKCYHAIFEANKMSLVPTTKLTLVSTLVAACVHRPLKRGLRKELQLIQFMSRLFDESRIMYNDMPEIGAAIRKEAMLGRGNLAEIPYNYSNTALLRSSYGTMIHTIVAISEDTDDHIERWKALGALANLTKTTNVCQMIVKRHQRVLTDITKHAQNHNEKYGTFGATLGQLEAVQIMANMSMCPGSILLWCQFSEGYKLAMDYTGVSCPVFPKNDRTVISVQPSVRSRCSRCNKTFAETNPKHDLHDFKSVTRRRTKVQRRGRWQRMGQTWWCTHCYADKVPGRSPAWIYHEEETATSCWKARERRFQLEESKQKDVDDMKLRVMSRTTEQERPKYPSYVPGTTVRILDSGRLGIITSALLGHKKKEEDAATKRYVIELDDVEEGRTKKMIFRAPQFEYVLSPALPPVRWGAKFGRRSMLIVSREGLPLPVHGWSISVWFRSGSWIRDLSKDLLGESLPGNKGKTSFLTLCESSAGDKLIALDHSMHLGSYEAASESNHQHGTWHSTEKQGEQDHMRLHNIKRPDVRQALGITKANGLFLEEKWVHLVVTGKPRIEKRSIKASMMFYLNGMLVSTIDFCPQANLQVIGNAAVGHQQWSMLSDFRLYAHPLDDHSTQWPSDLIVPPPTDSTTLRDRKQARKGKTNLPTFVRQQIVAAGSLNCLALIMRSAEFVSIRRAAMCTLANIACVANLRSKIIEIDGLIDIILTQSSNQYDSEGQDVWTDWIAKEGRELASYAQMAALALR